MADNETMSDEEILSQEDTDVAEDESKETEDQEDVAEGESKESDETSETDETEDGVEDKEETEDREEEDKEDKETEPQHKYLSYPAIKNDYPDIFKKHPLLRRAIDSDTILYSTFGSKEGAQEAAEKAEVLDVFDREVFSGSPDMLVNELHKQNPGAFKLFCNNFLPAILEKDPEVFNEITNPVIINTLNHLLSRAEASGEEGKPYATAVRLISKALYGKATPPNPVSLKRNRELTPEQIQFNRERAQFNNKLLNGFKGEILDSTQHFIRKEMETIIDPKRSLSKFLRDAIIDRSIEDLEFELQQDGAHIRDMQRRMRLASKNGYRPENKASVQQAILARARQSLRRIVSKNASEALKDSNTKIPSNVRTRSVTGAPVGGSKINGKINRADVDWSKTTDEQLLAGKPVLKRR